MRDKTNIKQKGQTLMNTMTNEKQGFISNFDIEKWKDDGIHIKSFEDVDTGKMTYYAIIPGKYNHDKKDHPVRVWDNFLEANMDRVEKGYDTINKLGNFYDHNGKMVTLFMPLGKMTIQ